MKFNFTIDLDELENPSAAQEIIEAIRTICKFLCNATPDYYTVGKMLEEQLERQLEEQAVSEENKLRDKFWHLYDDIVHYKFDAFPESLKSKIMYFVRSIGEAMGSICYSAYLVKREAETGITTDCKNEIVRWVNTCLKYYEENYLGVN